MGKKTWTRSTVLSNDGVTGSTVEQQGRGREAWRLLAVIKFIYLLPAYLLLIQDIEDRCLLLTSSTSFVDPPFQEHRMTKKYHMDQNPCISLICPK
jgi:hypothetical protein